MKVIKVCLPYELKQVDVHLFADEHIGDAQSDIKRLLNRIEIVKNDPKAYCVLNGDIIDYASRSSIGDIESRVFNINGQIEKAVELFEPIKDKILAITKGNHEARAYVKEGIDITKMIAAQLGLIDRYASGSAVLFIKAGTDGHGVHVSRRKRYVSQSNFIVYMVHGTGGGRKEGAKIIRLADMSSIIDADIYIHSHTHLPAIIREKFFRASTQTSTITEVDKLFINTAANLDYGGYGEEKEYKPNSNVMPVLHLYTGRNPYYNATL